MRSAFVVTSLALVLATAPEAAAAPAGPGSETAWGFELSGAVVLGTIAGSYVLAFAEGANWDSTTTLVSLPIAFAIGAATGIWGAARFQGIRGSFLGTLLATALPAALIQLVAVGLQDRDFRQWTVVVTPAVSVVSGLIAFELSREPGGGGEGTFVRRAVADERIR